MFDKLGKSNLSLIVTIVILFFILFVGFAYFSYSGIGAKLRWVEEQVINKFKGDPVVPVINEIVMPQNATITVKTDSGTITIKSGRGLRRFYTWNGATRSVVMRPRQDRWFGSLGIYYPAPGGYLGVVEEGQQNFDTLEAAELWLNKDCLRCIYTDHGLVVNILEDGEKINVGVWQIHIGGKTSSQYKETAFGSGNQAGKLSKAAEEFEARYRRNYYTDGEKPKKLTGSNNSVIVASWDIFSTK